MCDIDVHLDTYKTELELVWFLMVWYELVWFLMVWYELVWFLMVWYELVWYGNDLVSAQISEILAMDLNVSDSAIYLYVLGLSPKFTSVFTSVFISLLFYPVLALNI